MRPWSKIALVLAFVPLLASAQYKDPDSALANLTRGFGSGDPQAIISGIADGDQVMLQFPGLVENSSFFGRDQAAYFLDGLFNKVHPTGFEQQSVRKNSAQGQYNITANWSIQNGGKAEAPGPHITRRPDGGRQR